MIDYIKGVLTELTPTSAIVECGGIGYDISISLQDYSVLLGKQDTKLYIFESIREDAHLLYGFTTKRARELFVLLTGVSGVGPNTARMILSALTVGDLEMGITTGNAALLKSVKGIGAKTAERIIIDLRDKIKSDTSSLSSQPSLSTEAYEEALSALTMLGFAPPAARKVISKLFRENPALHVEDAIKQALKML